MGTQTTSRNGASRTNMEALAKYEQHLAERARLEEAERKRRAEEADRLRQARMANGQEILALRCEIIKGLLDEIASGHATEDTIAEFWTHMHRGQLNSDIRVVYPKP